MSIFSEDTLSVRFPVSIFCVGSIHLERTGNLPSLLTETCVLDELTKAYPRRLELCRTRGIVRTFRNEYWAAVKDFTHALQ